MIRAADELRYGDVLRWKDDDGARFMCVHVDVEPDEIAGAWPILGMMICLTGGEGGWQEGGMSNVVLDEMEVVE